MANWYPPTTRVGQSPSTRRTFDTLTKYLVPLQAASDTATTDIATHTTTLALIDTGAWSTYTPSLTQPGAISKTVTLARYAEVGKIVHGTVRLDVTGTGTTNNPIEVGLPVTGQTGTDHVIGGGLFYIASVALFYVLTVRTSSTTKAELWQADVPSPSQLGIGYPLASGDILDLHFTYEAA